MSIDLLWTGPADGPALVLAHGAGAPMDSPWLERMAGLLAEPGRGIRVARFEFAYMAARRSGTRRPPPKAETVMQEYRDAVAEVTRVAGVPVAIGGKSMGGRVASMVADDLHETGSVAALVVFGYPFHPPGAPEKLRTAHLEALATPTLILQGTRDPFGTRDEVAGFDLARGIRLFWLEDGEHELKPRTKISGFTHGQHLSTAADEAAAFVRSQIPDAAAP